MLAYPFLGTGDPKSIVAKLASGSLQTGQRCGMEKRRNLIEAIEKDFLRIRGTDGRGQPEARQFRRREAAGRLPQRRRHVGEHRCKRPVGDFEGDDFVVMKRAATPRGILTEPPAL
jgi:hypothetical protein